MNDPLRQLTALDVALNPQQVHLLQTIATMARDGLSWPTVARIDRAMLKARRRLVLVDELRNMPPGLLYRSSFRPLPIPTDTVPLTIVGLDRCGGFDREVEAFLAALRWCARAEQRLEPETDETDICVTRRQVARGIRLGMRQDQATLGLLYLLLQEHRWGAHQSSGGVQSEWQFRLGSDVRRFSKVDSVRRFVTTYNDWMTSLEALDTPTLSEVAVTAEPVNNSYVNVEVLASIRTMASLSPFELSKFVQLLEELDGSVQAGYVYGPHALLRAVLDHIPPIFGQPHFDAVAGNYPWSRTDRKYMQRLAAFRAQADDALHRQIGKSRDVLTAHDIPPAVMLNRLLIGCTEAMTTLISEAARGTK